MKNYKNFQIINEKFSLSNILFYAGLIYLGYSGYTKGKYISDMKKVQTEINSSTNYPVGKDKKRVDNILKETVIQIENSDLFNDYNKKMLIDSIKSATVKFVDEKDFYFFVNRNHPAAMYIELDKLTENLNNIFNIKLVDFHFKNDNIILISNKYKEDKMLPEILTHELYHYVDKLLDNYSDKIDFSTYIDSTILDNPEYLSNKIRIFMGLPSNKKSDEVDKILSDLVLDEFDYVTDNHELFVRWRTLKTNMQKYGHIDNINSILEMDDVTNYLNDSRRVITDIQLFMVLDIDKLLELDILLR